jgi:hypothetical protein
VSEEEFAAARAGVAERKKMRGRIDSQINVFARMIHDAYDSSAYFLTLRVDRGHRYWVLSNLSGAEGRSNTRSFPYAPFEAAVMSLLREIDPQEVLGRCCGPDPVQVLSGQLAQVEESVAVIEGELNRHGESAVLFRRLRVKEDEKRALTERLAEARQAAAHPLSEAWRECRTLAAVLDSAADADDTRLRLRSALRRIVTDIRLLVVARGVTRLGSVQLWFTNGGRRDYLIVYKPARSNGKARQEPRWWARSLATVHNATDLDLRDCNHACRLAEVLAGVELAALNPVE